MEKDLIDIMGLSHIRIQNGSYDSSDDESGAVTLGNGAMKSNEGCEESNNNILQTKESSSKGMENGLVHVEKTNSLQNGKNGEDVKVEQRHFQERNIYNSKAPRMPGPSQRKNDIHHDDLGNKSNNHHTKGINYSDKAKDEGKNLNGVIKTTSVNSRKFNNDDCAEVVTKTQANDGKIPRVMYIPQEIDESEEKLFQTLERGENFDKLNDHKVQVSGDNVKKQPINRFEDAALSQTVLRNIGKLGYTSLTPIQKWSIPVILDGRDVMACAQTGSGKTASFLIPILSVLLNNDKALRAAASQAVPSPVVLILSPTRELAIQTRGEIKKFSFGTIISSCCVYGGVNTNYQFGLLQKGCTMVVGTIGRIKDFVDQKKLDLSHVKFLVIDEADRMLEAGFHDNVTYLTSKCLAWPDKKRQTLMFSATFPDEIQELAYNLLDDYVFITVGKLGQANEDIKQVIWKVDGRRKKERLIEVLQEIGKEKVIVFVKAKRMADLLCIAIGEMLDLPITAVHGDLDQKEREEAIGFLREGKASVLMATSVAARGLDIHGIKHVINYDLPDNIDEYVHRIGRTARCGNTGRALSFFSDFDDANMAGPLVRVLTDAQQEVPTWLVDAVSTGTPVPRNNPMKTRDARRDREFRSRDSRADATFSRTNRGPAQITGQAKDEEEWS